MTGPKHKASRPEKAEVIYAALIKAGKVRVIRRRGKPPLIQWLDEESGSETK